MSEPHRAPAVERLDATVRGRVQGVGFRVWALREAMDLVLDGFVLNEADGSVRVVAEGPRAGLEALVDRLEDGPPGGAGRAGRRPLGAGAGPAAPGSGSRAADTAATDRPVHEVVRADTIRD